MSNETQQAPPSAPKKPRGIALPDRLGKALPPLHASRLKQSEFERSVWIVVPEVGTHPEELLDPSYWATIAPNLRPRDHLEIWDEGMGWYAEALVLDVHPAAARIHLRCVELLATHRPVSGDALLPGHTVSFAGQIAKWRVIRDKDRVVLKDGLDSEGAALAWLSDYSKRFSR